MLNMYFVMRDYDENHIVNYNAVHKLKKFWDLKKRHTMNVKVE